MGIIARQSLFNAAYTYFGIGLGFVTTIFLYPNILDPDQYGLTRVLVSASMIGAHFAHLGIRNTVIRFFPLFRTTNGNSGGLLFLAITVPLAGFILFGFLFWLFRDPLISFYIDRSPLFVDFFFYVLPITFFLLYFEVLNSYLRSLKDSISGSVISEVILRVAVILILAIYFFGLISFDTFILLFTVSYGLQPLLLILVLLRMGELNLSPRFDFLRKSLVRGMANYGIYTLLGGLTTVVVWNIDIMMLGSMTGLEQTAVYAIAFYIGTVIAVPKRAIDKIATPLIADHIHKNEWGKVEEIYCKTALTQSISGILILLLIWVNATPLLGLLPDVYSDGIRVILFIGLGKLFDMATGTNGSIILTSKHYRFDLITNILLVIFTVTTNLLLIPRYGIEGAAIATMLSIILYNLIKYLFVWIKFSMQPFSRDYLWLIFYAFLTLLVIWFIPEFSLILNLLVTVPVVLLTFLLPVWWTEMSPDLNQVLNNLFRHIFGKK